MNLTKMKNRLIGDKRFYRKVLVILLPIIIQNTVSNVVSLVDNVMVGAVGTLQMSAVAIVNQLLFIFYLCIFGGLAGAGIFAAQYAGAGDTEGVRHCFRMKLYIAALMSAIALTVFLLFSKGLISMYLAEGTSAADAASTLGFGTSYLFVMLIGLVPFAVTQVYGSTLRELGETRIPMVASVTAILINLVFNYVLIFGNKGLPFLPFGPMGVVGAAAATVLSRFVEAAIIVVYVHKNSAKYPFINGAYKSAKIPLPLFKDIVRKGSPLLINEFFWSLGMAILNQCYSLRGLEVVAATNISSTASNLFNVVFLSMGNAIAIMAGQYLGAGKNEKAKNTVWRLLFLSVTVCIVMGALLIAVSPLVPMLYNTSETVKEIARHLLIVVGALMPFYAFAHGTYFTLRSGGKTMITLVFDCGFTWLLAFPLAFMLSRFTALPIVPMFLAVQLLDVIKCIIGFILVKKGVWINNIVEKSAE
ncbi:MAG: MATE family efflux transporter [Clostridia bacterium]|nr:MATE family efflux transporter [Clostridia bacterium]